MPCIIRCGAVWCGVWGVYGVWGGVGVGVLCCVLCAVLCCVVLECSVVWCGVVCRRRCYQKAKAGMSTHGYR